jgi:hypothetical protein
MDRIDPRPQLHSRPTLSEASLYAGQDIRRKPGGRGCTVVQVSADRSRVQIRDGRIVFWARMDTVLSRWY